jgi:hypothetical protein
MASRPEVERERLRAGTTPTQEEADRFYAHRVGDYAKVVGGIATGLYVVGIAGILVLMPEAFWAFHLHPGKIFNLVLAVGALALWRVLQRPHVPSFLPVVADVGLPLGALSAVVPVAAWRSTSCRCSSPWCCSSCGRPSCRAHPGARW